MYVAALRNVIYIVLDLRGATLYLPMSGTGTLCTSTEKSGPSLITTAPLHIFGILYSAMVLDGTWIDTAGSFTEADCYYRPFQDFSDI